MSHYGNNGYDNGYPPQGPPQGPPRKGEAASYYESSQYPAPQYGQAQSQQYPPGFQPDGPNGERGVLGAIGGGLAGGVGGHAVGGRTNHSKLGSKSLSRIPPSPTNATY